MKVVHLSRTPLAGAPYELVKNLRKYANLDVKWVALRDRYRDGRVFPSELLWSNDRQKCLKAISESDIVHIHNESFPVPEALIKRKGIIVQYHSVPKRIDIYGDLKQLVSHKYTLLQPLQQREYGGLPGLPNLIDPEEYEPVKFRSWDKVRVTFAPTNFWPRHLKGSKAVEEVKAILDSISDIAEVRVFSDLAYGKNLKMKMHSDIIIDDVIGTTFHRTSLEGSCFGLAVLTSYKTSGWIRVDLSNLKETLCRLITNKEELERQKKLSREWVLKEWHPKNMVNYYVDAYEKVLKRRR